jgi:prepilin-type N-terminal cleavage/methylation domain-containing protein
MRVTRPSLGASGFTLIEMLVVIALLAVVMIGLLQMLDGASMVSKTQTDMTQMTENLRFMVADIVRNMRMTGTGGLPLLAPGSGGSLSVTAIDVQDNVNSGEFTITDAGGRTWRALPGTDVLTIRGVIGGIVYDVPGAVNIADYWGAGDSNFTVTLNEQSPFTSGRVQPLPSLVKTGTPVLFTLLWEMPVVVGLGQERYFSKYNIGIVSGDSSPTGTAPDRVLTLPIETSDSDYEEILSLNEGGDFEPFQQEYVITAGLLDDLVYFVSTNFDGHPALFLWRPSENTVVELVDQICGLHVALGIDLDNDGQIAEVGISANDDEWFYNTISESTATAAEIALLREVRVSLTGRTAHQDLQYTASPELPENSPPVTGDDLRYRYRSHSVRVSLRSHPPMS